MQLINKIGIISKPGVEQAKQLIPALIEWLERRQIATRYDVETAEYAGRKDGVPRETVPDKCQFIVVLGGDGTLLSAAPAIARLEISPFAVNLGGLGLLTAITPE